MSYESEVHHVQMIILRELLFTTSASFGELRRETGIDSDAFNFHLKQLVKSRYVQKDAPGEYRLTPLGKTYANRMDTEEIEIERQPKLSVVIILEDDKKRQLFQERLKQPYYGYWGHPTGKIRWGETMIEAAARELFEETGLSADLRTVGIYHKLDYDQASKELREDKYFCILHGTNPQGDLRDSKGCHNEWLTVEEFLEKPKRFGNHVNTERTIRSEHPTITENKFFYSPEHY